MPNPVRVLKNPGGETQECISGPNLSWSMETGWQWDAVINGAIDVTFNPASPWRIILDDGLGGVLNSPSLLASDPREATESITGDSTTLGGMDRTSWLLGQSGQSFATFRDTNSAAIGAQLAGSVGVTALGLPNYPVLVEEIKQSKISDALFRLARIAGYTWYVDSADRLVFIPFSLSGAGGGFALPATSVKRIRDPNRKTEFRWGKESAITGGGGGDNTYWFSEGGPVTDPAAHEITFEPMSNIIAEDVSTSGRIGAISFFDGPPTGGGGYIQTNFLDPAVTEVITPPPGGNWPATHAIVTVIEPGLAEAPVVAGVRLKGSSPEELPDQLERSFLFPTNGWYSTGEEPKRYIDRPIIDPLYPSIELLSTWAPRLVAYHNKDTDIMAYSGPMICSMALGETVSRSGKPDALIASISWPDPGPGGVPTYDLTAYVI